ncbi:mitofusin-2-like [Anneissia japonica]|uniref:mitofusin-2-like n=1 Tax=Anneissia japonica TaxID=1529436 RepID=UPI001425A55B|nr:mitofusin-2-like [Anneissia japonica]
MSGRFHRATSMAQPNSLQVAKELERASSPLRVFVDAKKKINGIFHGLYTHIEDSRKFVNSDSAGDAAIITAEEKEKIVGFSQQVDCIAEVLARDQMKVAFFGRTSNGKSTVVNAMMRDKVLPTGIGHTTDCFLSVEASNRDEAYIITPDSEEEKSIQSVTQIAHALSSDSLNDQSSMVRVFWPKSRCHLLQNDVVLMDSPGVDVTTGLDEWIDKYCMDADVFVLVSNAESTLMRTEKSFFHKVSEKLSKPNIFILNNRWDAAASEPEFMDAVKQQHLERAVDFLVNELKVVTAQQAEDRIFFVSAKEVLLSRIQKQQGMPESGICMLACWRLFFVLHSFLPPHHFQLQLLPPHHRQCPIIASTSLPTLVYASTSLPTLVTAATSLPTSVTASTSLPTSVTASTSLPTSVTAATSFPTSVTASTSLPTSVTASTSLPTSVTASTSLPTSVTASTSLPTSVTASTSLPTSVTASTSLPNLVYASTSLPTPVSASTSLPTLVYASTSLPTSVTAATSLPTSELQKFLEEGLGRNLDARCSSSVLQSIEQTQTQMTEHMSALLPEERQSQITNLIFRRDFDLSYRLDCRHLCADFQENIQFQFSLGLTAMMNKFLGPKGTRAALTGFTSFIPRQLPPPGPDTGSRQSSTDEDVAVAMVSGLASLYSRTSVGLIFVGGIVWKSVGWRVLAVAAGMYGGIYLYERLTWTNKAKERTFKRQFVEYSAEKLQLVVNFTSANCSHQIQQELSTTFARLCQEVDTAKEELNKEIVILDAEKNKLEKLMNDSKLLRNRANWLESELTRFIRQYLGNGD